MTVGTTRKRQAGMTMIELMIALAVLLVGMTGVMALFLVAVQANTRARLDTGAGQLSQMLMEQMASRSAPNNASFTLTDCATPANTWTIATTAGGATLDANGNVNWGSSDTYAGLLANNYAMKYVTCAGSTTATYEVRWNVTTTTFTRKYLAISSRPIGSSTANGGSLMFSLPITLRTIVGN